MKKPHSFTFALCAAAFALPLLAAPPKKASKPPVELVLETTAENLILPSSPAGIVVFRECKTCPPSSLRTGSSTLYRLNSQEVTLQEFRASLSRLPATNVNVVVSGRTHELIALNAVNETPVSSPPPRRKSK
jgi:hypothetical protein